MPQIIYIAPFITLFLFSLLITGILSKTVRWMGADKKKGIQKHHKDTVSRLGGLSLTVSICLGIYLIKDYYADEYILASILMITFLPIIMGGIIEDFTHKVSPRTRLILAFISSLLVIYITKAFISNTGFSGLDIILRNTFLSFILLILIIIGFTNSMNIIDGFHGLASGSALLMITSISLIAYKADDFLIVRISLLLIITILGFFVWNWPFGKIFLGDGGAYLLGIWIVVLGILLQFRSTSVSPMAPVLIGVYPLIETIFTIYRRKCLRNNKIVLPDALHLHSLVYRRLINKSSLSTKLQANYYNACVSIYVWLFIIIDCLIAVTFYQNTSILMIGILISIISYVVIYISIIKFKFPKSFIIFR